jgi:hypothetical protein
MKATHSLVVLGLLALLTGLVGLYGVTHRGEISRQDPVAVDQIHPQPGAPDGAVPGVDDSITRVLASLGMIERRSLTGPGAIPEEVARILTALNVPLVLDQPAGVVP